jgi:ABC-type uncharacterized transport system permease subunit
MLAREWLWVAGLALVCMVLWDRGLRRFQAYGG